MFELLIAAMAVGGHLEEVEDETDSFYETERFINEDEY